MSDKQYRDMMDKLEFSKDFEQRTLQKLARAKKRRAKGKITLRAAIGFAACLALVLVALPLLRKPVGQIAPVAVTPTATVAPSENAAPDANTDDALDGAASGRVVSKSLATADMEMAALTSEYSMAMEVMPAPAFNLEEYKYMKESGFRDVLTSPLSTFAADVDTASYSNVRRMILDGGAVPESSVRVEEMLNYFTYAYPEPTDGAPFALKAEIADCPWNANAKLLLLGLQTKKLETKDLPASNLVFLIDVSGSMNDSDKLPLAQKAFRLVCDSLRANDRVSIVTYAGADSVVLEGADGADGETIRRAIDELFASGSTAGAAGIETAYNIAEKYFIPGGNNRVILATDGDMNVGVTSEGELTRLIEEKKQSGVYLSVLGFGSGNLKDNNLESLADHVNGNYSYIDSELEAKRVLVSELGATFFTVAKDVKLQIEFNPDRVKSYRQIGYENRQMAAEDFADDTKDGGEIGAGHSVTVLYELILTDGESDAGALKYQTGQTTGSSEYMTLSVRAKAPDGDVSHLYEYPIGEDAVVQEMDADMAFAACVAQTGMLLSGSEYAGSASYDAIADALKNIDGVQDDPARDEFAYLVRRLSMES